MQGSIDWVFLILKWLHSFNSLNNDSISTLIRVTMTLWQFYNSFLSNSDLINEHLNSLLTVFVDNFKLLSEIIEYLSIRPIAVNWQEMNWVLPAVFVQSYQLVVTSFCCYHHLVPFQVIELRRIVFQLCHFHICVQLLQFVETTLKPWLIDVFFTQKKLATQIWITYQSIIPNCYLPTST